MCNNIDMVQNITLSANADMVREARSYAREHGTSLNTLIRGMLAQIVARRSENWVENCLKEMDAARGHSRGRKWTREELHRG